MWKPEHRRAADRTGLRYPSDLSDAEWLIVEPMIPPAKRGGRRRSVNVREVLNGIFYVLWTGCQWKALPKDLPPKSTVHDYLELWNWDGTLERIHHDLYVAVREQEGREPSPTVAIIDSQTAKGSQNVWPAPSASGFCRAGMNSLHKRIRPFGYAVGQDGDPRVPVLIKGTASRCHFCA
jgi:transposase